VRANASAQGEEQRRTPSPELGLHPPRGVESGPPTILVVAFACRPGAGSEPGVGWEWARAIARNHHVIVVTRTENVGPILRDPSTQELGIEVLGFRAGSPSLPDLARYAVWYQEVTRAIPGLLRAHRPEVLHHLTYATDWLPSPVMRARGLPIVWGPVGGSTRTPFRLLRWLSMREIMVDVVRSAVIRLLLRWNLHRLQGRQVLAVAQNPDVAARLRRSGLRTVLEPNAALDPDAWPTKIGGRDAQTALYVGRLIGWKGIRLLLAAFERPELRDWRLDVIGDGPLMPELLARIEERASLRSRVRLRGKISRPEVAEAMRTATALALPSMHDSAPWVVAEATTSGLPVLCLDLGGPPLLARESAVGSLCTVLDPRTAGPESVARSLRWIAARENPSCAGGDADRWSRERIPALVAEWYRTAGGGPTR
jgi:glycosyltransferase involved in cell wall biosynthesis